MNPAGLIADRQVGLLMEQLASRHGPDWLERVGRGAGYKTATLWTIAGGMVLTLAGQWPAWWMLVPYVAWKIVTRALPELVWKRKVTAPRWAHDDVALEQAEIELVEHWISQSDAAARVVRKNGLPRNGRELWALMEQVALAEDLARSMQVIRETRGRS